MNQPKENKNEILGENRLVFQNPPTGQAGAVAEKPVEAAPTPAALAC